jgi:hypothetical protein
MGSSSHLFEQGEIGPDLCPESGSRDPPGGYLSARGQQRFKAKPAGVTGGRADPGERSAASTLEGVQVSIAKTNQHLMGLVNCKEHCFDVILREVI